MICYLRSSTIQYDVRLQKYILACQKAKTPYVAFTWDRVNNCSNCYDNEFQYKRLSPYGRRWKNLFNLILWQFHLLFVLLKNRHSYRVIHACNIDTLFPALFMKFFGKKVVFDIYDSVAIPLERFTAKYIVDVLILPNVRRLKQISLKKNDLSRFLEIENVPSFDGNLSSRKKTGFPDIIHLAYVGIFERNIRGLENLINEVLVNDSLILDIAGIGSGLEAFVSESAKKSERIKYYGSVDYSKALEIMNNSDFIVAMYYNLHPLHKFASPNKYYESLFLGVPLITTKDTLVGDMAIENQTGYAIGENQSDLHNFFNEVHSEKFMEYYIQYSINAKKIWNKKFYNYWEKRIYCDYIQVMYSL